MASQQYAPATPRARPQQLADATTKAADQEASPTKDESPLFTPATLSEEEKSAAAAALENQRVYAQKRDLLIEGIEDAGDIVKVLRSFSRQDRWIVRYPNLSQSLASSNLTRSQSSRPGGSLEEADVHRPAVHRSTTTAGVTASAPNTPTRHRPVRSQTSLRAPAENENDEESEDEKHGELSVLRVDLKMGAHTRNPSELVHSLEKSTVAQLLDGRLAQSLRHLDSLKQRISDKQSKVLVTGDLNAGKSTLVNALLRREVMPTDQQPCTTVFCEVLDANETNDGREEVHMLLPNVKYDATDDKTFTRYELSDVERIVAEAEDASPEDAPMIKCYCVDTRTTKESLLHNGVTDIALIDAPGLNRDSLKTTALFARQEEIDVVLFCLSAENHFTLSAKEFLWNASNDKAYIFIVVNKFDQIKNKEKCRRMVLEQIKQLSPRTYEDAADLVHFVDSSSVLDRQDVLTNQADGAETPGEDSKVQGEESETTIAIETTQSAVAFAHLEAALRDFVLLKRSKSKLLPAQTYLLRLLFDVAFLARTNAAAASVELEEARAVLAVARPALAKCQEDRSKLEVEMEGAEDEIVSKVAADTESTLEAALERLSKGDTADASVSLPAYPGLFDLWTYVTEVRAAMTRSINVAVSGIEDTTRLATASAVDSIQAIGIKYLPADSAEKKQQFIPEAMFRRRRDRGLGFAGLGLSSDITEARVSDVFDVQHHWSVVVGSASDKSSKEDTSEGEDLSIVSSLSLGLGALTIVSGKTMGVHAAVQTVSRIADLVSNPTARRWAAPVAALVSTGLIVYLIVDLPNSIPRNVGRSLRKELANGTARHESHGAISIAGPGARPLVAVTFSTEQATRISRETRKVLRLASFDIQDRFRDAIAKRQEEVEAAEQKESNASAAKAFYDETGLKAHMLKETVQPIGAEK